MLQPVVTGEWISIIVIHRQHSEADKWFRLAARSPWHDNPQIRASIEPHMTTAQLDEEGVVQVLRDSPEIRKVRIDGHTDARGTPVHNRRLSHRRAQSVLQYLVQAGIDRSRLAAKGFGPDQPLVPNDTASHRAKNRRVEFVVLDGPKPAAAQ